MKIISAKRCEVTVKRPDGKIETVVHPKITHLNDALLVQVNKAMAAAGRGEILSYRNIAAVFELEDGDYQTKCGRCGTIVDCRTSYSQQELSMFCGHRSNVKTHYCECCHKFLAAVGVGEKTALEERKLDGDE